MALRRPLSYSDSFLEIPRVRSNLRALLDEQCSTPPPNSEFPLFVETPKHPNPPNPPNPRVELQELPPPPRFVNGTIKITVHLLLVSLFETFFFWYYISETENKALVNLVNGYVLNAFQSCSQLNSTEQIIVEDLFYSIFNATQIQQQAILAHADRESFNQMLVAMSWIYVSILASVFGVVASLAKYKAWNIRWQHFFVENLSLVACLGLFEFLFFRTIVIQYKAITIDELDETVVSEFQNYCSSYSRPSVTGGNGPS